MDSYSANDAKTQFGQLLMKVQREPVQINKSGKPVAVMISMEAYQTIEKLVGKILGTTPGEEENAHEQWKQLLLKMKGR
jgi:prevent-host-death family protein